MEEEKKYKKTKKIKDDEDGFSFGISSEFYEQPSAVLPTLKGKKKYKVIFVTEKMVAYEVSKNNYSHTPNTFEKSLKAGDEITLEE
jgi:hypothetical protein